jgi:hypothetical protein
MDFFAAIAYSFHIPLQNESIDFCTLSYINAIGSVEYSLVVKKDKCEKV